MFHRRTADRALRPRWGVVGVARWSARHPWRAILAWGAFVGICLVAGAAAGTKTLSDPDTAVGQWGRAEKIVASGHFADPVVENVLITARSGRLSTSEAAAAVAQARTRLGVLPAVARVRPAVTAPDGRAVLLPVELTGKAEAATDTVVPVLAATAQVARSQPQLRIEEVGPGSIDRALSASLGKDFHRAELVSIPIALALLLLAFGAVIAAGIPVLLALSAVAAAVGLSALTSQLLPVTEALSSIVLLVGMAVGVDYSLFYLRRAREERERGASTLDAVELAAATSGRAVVVSGITVIVAMAGMLLSGTAIFRSLAIGTTLVVAVAVVGSVTVLPALLAKLGDNVDRPRVPLVHRLRRPGADSRVWRAVLRPVLRRPAIAFTVAVAGLLALAAPAFGMRTAMPGDADLPRSIPIVASYDRLIAAFPDTGSTHQVAVAASAGNSAAVRHALADLVRRTQSSTEFATTPAPAIRTSADGRVSTVDLPIPYDATDARAARSLTELRQQLVPDTVGRLAGAQWAVGGETAADTDVGHVLTSRLPWVFAFVLGLSFLVMLITFRSPVIAATAITLNLLSVGAAYGLLVMVFQHTWAEGLLGFTSNGAIVTWLPMFLFVILFGLSMDYHVFVVSRIREAALAGAPTREAVRIGITRSAGVVTSAAAVMVAVFGIFATLTGLDFKQLGVGLAAAILLDATVVRAMLLPATMALLGRWNWWTPAWLAPSPCRASPPQPTRELEPAR